MNLIKVITMEEVSSKISWETTDFQNKTGHAGNKSRKEREVQQGSGKFIKLNSERIFKRIIVIKAIRSNRETPNMRCFPEMHHIKNTWALLRGPE